MARNTNTPPDISRLAGYIPAPRNKVKVFAWIATLEFPFLLNEAIEGTGLRNTQIQKVLDRGVKAGLLTRHKVPIHRHRHLKYEPGVSVRDEYLYSVVAQ